MELKFDAPRKKELLALETHDVNGKDKSIIVRNEYPPRPVPRFEVTEGFDFKKAEKFVQEWDVKIAKSIANDIIIPDPAPQSAVLLLPAQEQIRGGSSSKINGSSKKNRFDIINKCVVRLSFSLKWEKGSHGMAQELLEERKTLIDCAWLLVDVISHAGEDLSAYIQAHSEVPHVEVFQHVSSILKEYGFCATRDFLDTINLRPYDCRKSDGESCKDANMAVTETANLDAAEEKAVRKKVGGGWDPTYTKRSFFPYWRSVLLAQFPVKVYPSYAWQDPRSGLKPGQLRVCVSKKLMASGSRKLGPVQRMSPRTSNNQPMRCFITAATGAFRILKVLK